MLRSIGSELASARWPWGYVHISCVSQTLCLYGATGGLQDSVTAKRNLAKYSSLDTTFSSTREAKFVNVLIEALEAGDSEMFTGAVFEYDQVTKLDNWKTNILLKIKRSIQEEPDLR